MTLLVGAVILVTLLRHRRVPHTMASADEHVEDAAPGAGGESALTSWWAGA